MKGRKPDIRIGGSVLKIEPTPSWLAKHAKAEWERVMPALIERRILTDADLGSLENYCICIGRIRQCEEQIQTEPDAEMRLKLIRVQDKAMASSRQLAAELGLTPVSRSRPTVREEEDADEGVSPLDL